MTNLEKARVLLAEDNHLIAQLIKALLEKKGYTVVGEAANGLQAVEMVYSLRPDIVIMDVQMPDMDGIAASHQIQEQCPTPVVILTAFESEELVERASRAGVGAYLVKPPNPEELERAIVIALARFQDMLVLRSRNRELDAFAHTVAHDLKNPLSVLIGTAELLEEDYLTMPAEDMDQFLHTISEKGRKAMSIVDELLLLASLRSTAVEVGPLDMSGIVSDVLLRLSSTMERRQTDLVLPTSWPVAEGYRPWVEEVWVNYLDNAVKYGGNPARVEIGAVNQDGGMVRFWVKDNGDGLDAADRAKLFTPLERLDQVQTKGHGLGLSIVQRIIEKLGGQVGVESSGKPGEGSCFYFVLPQPVDTGPSD